MFLAIFFINKTNIFYQVVKHKVSFHIQKPIGAHKMSQQSNLQLNDLVQFTAQQDAVFSITRIHADGTFDIEHQLSSQQVLSYEMVSQEMLRKIVK